MDKNKVDIIQERKEKTKKCDDAVRNRNQTFEDGKKSYSGQKRCQCMDCGKSFTRNSSLLVHQRIHTGEKLFMCSECGKRFGLKSSMVRHMGTHTPKALKICPDCGKCFSRYSSLFQHQKVHRKERLYRCPYCENNFTRSSHLVVHQRIHKQRPLPERSDCGENRNNLDKPGTQQNLVCLECGKYFKDHRSLMRHQRIHKESTTVPTNRNDGFAHGFPFNVSEDCNVPQSLQTINRLDQIKDESFYTEKKAHQREKRVLCIDCGKSFTRKSSLIVHQRTHTGEKLFMCSECGRRFGLKSSLVRHMRTHSPKIRNICTDCGKCFSRYSSLFQHQKVHKRDKPYKCPQCEKSFSRASQLAVHEKKHKAEIFYKKSESDEHSDFLDKENDHLIDKNAGKSHICLECGKRFRCQNTLIKHKRIHKGNCCLFNTQNSIFHSDAKSAINCNTSKPVKKDDTEAPKQEQPDIIENSNLGIDKESYIAITFGDNTDWKAGSEAKSFLCMDCGKSFTRKSSLIVHQRTHTGEKLFMCTDCGKRFGLKSSLVRHMRTHSPKMLNICSDCGKCFSRYSSLFQHQKVHRREKPYKCPQCEKSFSRASQLLFHRRTHKVEKSNPKSEPGEDIDVQDKLKHYVKDTCTGESHVCLECGKPFTEQHLLNRHQRTHIGNCEPSTYKDLEHNADSIIPAVENCNPNTLEIICMAVSTDTESEEVVKSECAIDNNSNCKPRLSSNRRPYHCIQCGKNFTRKSSLIVHQRIHTGEKLFICTECGKRFGFKSSLVRHLRTHTGQMLNICSECGIYFSRYCDLVLHLENHMGQLQFTRNALSTMETRDEQREPNPQQSLKAHQAGVTAPVMKEQSGQQQKDQPPCGSGYLLPVASSLKNYLHPHFEEKIQEGSVNIKQETPENLYEDGDPTKGQKNEDVCALSSPLDWGSELNISKSAIEECFGKTDETRNRLEQSISNMLNNNNLGNFDGPDQIPGINQSREKQFLCSECGKNFTRKSSLIVHQRTHTGEKLFMCTECGKRFGLKSSMVRHMRTHNAEYFKCLACGKNFRDYSKFLEHQTSHSGELPYTEP
ncbi:uncharacterized protein LOC142749513 [Rhinoderma darwinii]|uniref:uncharacterized protein LOC142749513 n=1 Tax=Rhinoderma darwinii TaxID=43563 RepID=UPI003F679530